MKKVLVCGINTVIPFWNAQLQKANVEIIYCEKRKNVLKYIFNERPDVIIVDEYFSTKKWGKIAKQLTNLNIEFFWFSDRDNPEKNRLRMNEDSVNSILDKVKQPVKQVA